MTIELSVIISIVSVTFAVVSGFLTLRRNKSNEDKKEASEMTTVIVKLESISKDTSEIKNDLRSVKDDVRHQGEQIIRLDESLKSAWKAINRIQDKAGDSE